MKMKNGSRISHGALGAVLPLFQESTLNSCEIVICNIRTDVF